MDERLSWDELFMGMVGLFSRRSACKHFKVGAVFVRNNRFLTAGYNGPPVNEPNCIEDRCAKEDEDGNRLPGGSGLCRGAHAEMNAIANAGVIGGIDLRNSTVYCTYSPCYDCSKILVNLGIKEYVYQKDYHDDGKETAEMQLFKRQGIIVRKFQIKGGK